MKLGLILLALLSLLACETDSSDPKAKNQEAKTKILDSPRNLRGYFVKAAHDGAWLLQLKENQGQLSGQLIKYEGMLPPAEFLDSKDAQEDIIKKLEITELKADLYTGKFESNLGKGKFSKKKILFESIDDGGEILVLSREASYPTLEE